MKHWRKRILIFAVLLLGFALLIWAVVPKQKGPKLSITFAGFTNNPVRGVTPTGRVEVCAGAMGTCALFFVRNVTTNQYLWFNTASVQLREEQGWRTFEPIGGVWSGVEGSLWSPSYGCLYAVGWPPGLPTNASWRLQVRYGKDPSLFGIVVNQRLGREIFRSGKEEAVVPSDLVEPPSNP